jgi:hypothetical protein
MKKPGAEAPGSIRNRASRGIRSSEFLGFVVMFHSYEYISVFAPFFHIPVSLGNFFQGIPSINDRFNLPRLN